MYIKEGLPMFEPVFFESFAGILISLSLMALVVGIVGFLLYKKFYDDSFHIALYIPGKIRSMPCEVIGMTKDETNIGLLYARTWKEEEGSRRIQKPTRNVKKDLYIVTFKGDYELEMLVPKSVYDHIRVGQKGIVYYYKSYFKKFTVSVEESVGG
jgi:hypothetical protein